MKIDSKLRMLNFYIIYLDFLALVRRTLDCQKVDSINLRNWKVVKLKTFAHGIY